ncbi:biotin synthase BioB [Orrella sp. JC864]|uniref:biotin synthase BioB n=1 Tax=Orrella sp. JC864 TaxID=3120298 RepID=UPI0012BB5574
MSCCPSPGASAAQIPAAALAGPRAASPLPARQGPSIERILAWYALPFPELIYQAQAVHRQHFDPASVELASLLSIKTGGCPEDCAYCPQSSHYDTGVDADKLMPVQEVVDAARRAQAAGAQRFCMGAAWRSPKPRHMQALAEIVRQVKALGMQTCMTLGMLEDEHARALAQAGLDYYNHNLDTAPEFYGRIITTRTYQERLDTLQRVRQAGIRVCCGGIVGMGESRRERAGLIHQLASLDPYPESVPINHLVRVAGTPLAQAEPLDPFEFVRTIAVARLAMPRARVRLSAGREQMPESLQALCLLAGANSIFYGDTLLVTANPQVQADQALLARLGLRVDAATHPAPEPA